LRIDAQCRLGPHICEIRRQAVEEGEPSEQDDDEARSD
jgi:hypothetical protein